MMNLSCSGSTEKHLVFDFSVGLNKNNNNKNIKKRDSDDHNEWTHMINAEYEYYTRSHTQTHRQMAIFKCTVHSWGIRKRCKFYVRLFCRKIFSIPLIKTCFEMCVCAIMSLSVFGCSCNYICLCLANGHGNDNGCSKNNNNNTDSHQKKSDRKKHHKPPATYKMRNISLVCHNEPTNNKMEWNDRKEIWGKANEERKKSNEINVHVSINVILKSIFILTAPL